jgi:membrane-bound lytic murein transglycosylase D
MLRKPERHSSSRPLASIRVASLVAVTPRSAPARGIPGWLRGVAALYVAAALGLAGCASTLDPTAPSPAQSPAATPAPSPAPASPGAPDIAAAAPVGGDSLPVVGPTAAPDTLQANGRAHVFAVDPLRPLVVIDPDDPSVRTDLWIRVRAGFAMPDLQGDLVLKWERWYASRPDYVQRMTERGGRYLFYVVEEIEKRGMPTELALLPFIESAFNPQAMSVARASGMWQFMPATGKDFDLRQNVFRDDRRDVLASTRAALDYLEMLYRQFNDWQLALAAYNWGQGSVQRAIDRANKAGTDAGYVGLRMPDETRNYVPKLQAVKNIIARPQDFAITLPPLQNHPYFLGVPITNDIDVDVAARLAGISLEEFQSLNPQMNKPVILAAGTPQVLLPYDNATLFVRNLQAHHAPLATWTAWVAPKTLKPEDAARQVGMSESDLRAVNRIPPRMLIKAGSTLVVPRGPNRSADVSVEIADNASITLAPEKVLRRISFKVGRKGDSVAAVARRYKVSPAQVAEWNSVASGARFAPGQTVVVMKVQAASSTKRSAAKTTKRSTASKSKGKSSPTVAGSKADAKL